MVSYTDKYLELCFGIGAQCSKGSIVGEKGPSPVNQDICVRWSLNYLYVHSQQRANQQKNERVTPTMEKHITAQHNAFSHIRRVCGLLNDKSQFLSVCRITDFIEAYLCAAFVFFSSHHCDHSTSLSGSVGVTE